LDKTHLSPPCAPTFDMQKLILAKDDFCNFQCDLHCFWENSAKPTNLYPCESKINEENCTNSFFCDWNENRCIFFETEFEQNYLDGCSSDNVIYFLFAFPLLLGIILTFAIMKMLAILRVKSRQKWIDASKKPINPDEIHVNLKICTREAKIFKTFCKPLLRTKNLFFG
jgi:hypothetical protein